MAERLKVKFLTVIWGARYIDEFARISLPSYLAEGNLPSLAAGADLEVLVMTSRASVPAFEGKPAFEALRRLCPVRFIFIDDLITTGCYGVTLTLAYARGIADSGAAQTETTFVFMNSDFVLADGALATLLARLEAGDRCVMAPSLRACAEAALPVLAEAVDRRGERLAMPPRAMVQLAFDALHPTVIAKTVSQRFVTCTTHNQIYWQVDGTTLLGRYHLLFMLAIRPEVPLGRVNSYCDYGLVPELVPSGQFTVLDDSDAIFMLELQQTTQERHFVHCGVKAPAQIARELSVWTTREHRRFATVDVVFRTGELPAGIAEARARLADYMEAVQARMSRRPKDHADHLYWVLGVEAWRWLRDAGGEALPLPPELEGQDAVLRRRLGPWWRPVPRPYAARRTRGRDGALLRLYTALLVRARRAIGTVPNVPVWHHLWPDLRLVRDWICTLQPSERHLLVCISNSVLAPALARNAGFEVRTGLDAFLKAEAERADWPALETERYRTVLLHLNLHQADVRRTRRLIEAVRPILAPGGTVAIYIDHPYGEPDADNFAAELAQCLEDMLPAGWIGCDVSARFAGGRIKRRLRRLERRVLNQLWPSSWTRLPLLAGAMLLWPVVAALTAANNLRMGRPSETWPVFCTSALVVISGVSAAPPGPPRAGAEAAEPALAAADPGRSHMPVKIPLSPRLRGERDG
jgi:hypothetical protein